MESDCYEHPSRVDLRLNRFAFRLWNRKWDETSFKYRHQHHLELVLALNFKADFTFNFSSHLTSYSEELLKCKAFTTFRNICVTSTSHLITASITKGDFSILFHARYTLKDMSSGAANFLLCLLSPYEISQGSPLNSLYTHQRDKKVICRITH